MLRPMPWYQRILRIEPGLSLATWAYERIANNWHWLVAIFVAGGGMSYLASATEWLSSWGPAGIGAVGLASALLTWLALAGASLWRAKALERRARAHAISQWKEQVDSFNPLEDMFNKKRMRVVDLANPITHQINKKNLIDCELLGPANIYFVGKNALNNTTLVDCDIVVLRRSKKLRIVNVVRVQDVTMVGGAILRCTIFIRQAEVPHFVKMGASFMTLTGVEEIDNQLLLELEEEKPQ